MATKATTSTPKAKTVSPKTRTKKKADGATGNGSTATLPIATFHVSAEAFTVPTTPDPGPKRDRYGFAKIPNVLDLPDLIELQKASFKWFIGEGLRDAFDSIDRSAADGNAQARDLVSYFVGQGVGLIDSVKSAGAVVQEFKEEFVEAVEHMNALVAE